MSGYVGRFAPSPTGPLHAGSLVAAAASYLQARASKGRWLLRIEDIDPPREVKGASEDIIRTLARFGFRWDGPIVYQSKRLEQYRSKLDLIRAQTFYCQCSRRAVREAQARTNCPDNRYPGTCRDAQLTHGIVRFRLDRPASFDDALLGHVTPQDGPDDFVLWRRDDLPSYQWAVCVDDAAQGVTEVVRGRDLLETTPRQIAVMRALCAPLPGFAHVPIVVNQTGQKLSKQTGASALPVGGETQTLCAALGALGLHLLPSPRGESLDSLWSRATAAWSPSLMTQKEKVASF